jgi:probable HAF family extracellular repeat protein
MNAPRQVSGVASRTCFVQIIIAYVLLLGAPLRAQEPFFMGLGDLPGGAFQSWASDVSGDGSIVVGRSEVENRQTDAFRWTRDTGMTALNAPTTFNHLSVSTDGTTIVGNMGAGDPNRLVPYRWTQETGVQALPLLAGTDRWTTFGVNVDGSVIVGQTSLTEYHAIKWSATDGTAALFDESNLQARDISDDSEVILGIRLIPFGVSRIVSDRFIWRAEQGFQSLSPPALGSWYEVDSISREGKVVLGGGFLGGDIYVGSGNHRALRWTEETGTLILPPTPDGAIPFCLPCGMSQDGSVIAGIATLGMTPSSDGFDVFIWDQIRGTRNFREVLTNEYDLADALAGWELGFSDISVSADGRTIVGTGTNPQGNQEAWIAYLGPLAPSLSGDYNGNGTVDATDYVVWRNLSGQAGAGLAADGNGDGTVNAEDYEVWRANFGQTMAGSLSASLNDSRTSVPEPSTLLLTSVAFAPLAWRRRALSNAAPFTLLTHARTTSVRLLPSRDLRCIVPRRSNYSIFAL